MIASNITKDVLIAAADKVKVTLDIDTLSGSGKRHKVKVYPFYSPSMYKPSGRRKNGAEGNAPYQKISVSQFNYGRRVHAICWHGFRDFFRACYAIEPNARFKTAVDTWLNSEDFEARFEDSATRQVGSFNMPFELQQCCRCKG